MTNGFNPFDPSTTIPRITTTLAGLDAQIERIRDDRDLSDQGKAKKIAQISDPVLRGVQGDAGGMLAYLGRQVDKTQQSLTQAEKDFDASIDPVRATLALTQAQVAATSSDWPKIRPMIDRAIAHQDVPSLRAWSSLGDSLRQRFGQDQRWTSDILKASEDVQQALDAAVPDTVRQARQAAQQAQQTLIDASEKVDRVDFERSLQGRPAIFRDVLRPRITTATMTEDNNGLSGFVMAEGSIW